MNLCRKFAVRIGSAEGWPIRWPRAPPNDYVLCVQGMETEVGDVF